MDFIRKNWSRLSLALLYFIGGVIAVIAWINNSGRIAGEGWVDAFYNTSLLIATVVFFFGMVGITVVKTLQNTKKAVSIMYMCIGSLISVLLTVLIVVASCQQSSLILIYGKGAVNALYQLWIPYIVFGLHLLIKGITRFIEAESVPAQAKPVAQPATATVAAEAPKATAPKATAKKAAPKTPAAK